MAARENQGYVIGIIVLAVLAVMLLVTTVFSMMKAYENYDNMVAAREDAKFQGALATANSAKSNMLSAMIGAEGTAASEITVHRDLISNAAGNAGDRSAEINQIAEAAMKIHSSFQKDMAFNRAITDGGEEEASETETYKGTVDKMSSALRSSNENAYSKSKEALRIEEDARQKIAIFTTKLEERNKALAQAEQDLAQEKQDNAQKEKALFDQAKALQALNESMEAEFQDEKDKLEIEIAKIIEDRKFVIQQNTAMKVRINEYEKQYFDRPDGQIVNVSETAGNVFIDMGRDDGIRANLTFAVYDRTANDFEKDRHKAMIEVTEVLGPHLSKARVTDEDPLNPILRKDQVLSATFDRGDAVTIALGGFFDLDGDGLSDVEKLKRMIVRNGGRVVASHDDDGNISGEIDSTTRFFVLGPSPRSGTRSVVTAMADMKKQAEGNAVDTIDLRKLLNWMGVHGSAKIERMDSRIGETTGFQPRQPSDN